MSSFKIHRTAVPCLIFVPFWFIGIVISKQITIPFSLFLASLLFVLTLFLFPKTRNISIILISLLGGYIALKNQLKRPVNHFAEVINVDFSEKYESKNNKWSVITNNSDADDEIELELSIRIVSSSFETQNSSYCYNAKFYKINETQFQGKCRFYNNNPNFVYGDILFGKMKINKYNTESDIYTVNSVNNIQVIDNIANPILKKIHSIKKSIKNKCISYLKYSHPIAVSMIIGERNNLPDIDLDFNETTLMNSGLMHLFTVSGLHVGILVFILNVFLKLIYCPDKIAKILIICIIIFYSFLCNNSVPVVRAVIFFSLLLFSEVFYKKISKLQIILLTAFFILLYDPLSIFSYSFILTFVATLGIYIGNNINKKLYHFFIKKYFDITKIWNLLFIYFIRYFIVTSITILFISPILIAKFQKINLNSFFGNVISFPLLSALLFLFFLFIILPTKLFFMGFLIDMIESLTKFFVYIIEFIAKFPFNYNYSTSLFLIFLCEIFLISSLIILLIANNKKSYYFSLLLFIISFTLLFFLIII